MAPEYDVKMKNCEKKKERQDKLTVPFLLDSSLEFLLT